MFVCRIINVVLLAMVMLLSATAHANFDDLNLWYRQPAEKWIEALAVGNGRLGAMVFGKTAKERIQFNEDTVWAGGPYKPVKNSEGPQKLLRMRRLVFEGKYLQAQNMFGPAM
ncbi:MAG: glycoside hydrolase N-terminal domain-containing protein, partial [Planctomycetota bacterium]